MAIDPFKATQYQVGKILDALSSDSDGNLIFADDLNPAGITLTELIESGGSGSGVGVGYTQDVATSDFTPTSYTFSGEATFLGFEVDILHNFVLSKKTNIVVSVFETGTGRKIEPQEIIAITGNYFKLIMATNDAITVSVQGF